MTMLVSTVWPAVRQRVSAALALAALSSLLALPNPDAAARQDGEDVVIDIRGSTAVPPEAAGEEVRPGSAAESLADDVPDCPQFVGDAGDGWVRLADGSVLAVGSAGCGGDAAASWLVEADGSAQRTGPMAVARTGFALLRLPDGDVLAFGGKVSGGIAAATDAIERYDVATGRWSAAGRLAERRAGAGICPLDSGRLLVVGGAEGDAARSAEILDAAGGGSARVDAPTSFPHGGRVSAVGLDDGRCLLSSAGGLEYFDPETESFAAAAPFAPANVTFAAKLPDGTVLFVADKPLIFDPATGAYSEVPMGPSPD